MVDLLDFEQMTGRAVQAFWKNRREAHQNSVENDESRRSDERSAVTAGKNMDGFVDLVNSLVMATGPSTAVVHQRKNLLILPGFFRPTKRWDVLVINEGRLIAALEFKSQVGPSFGNNFNNRAEEAIGSAQDLWTAFREGAFGEQTRPFVGWLILVEDSDKSRAPVGVDEPHFPVSEEFHGASYVDRYNLLGRKLVQEGLYSAATVLASPKSAERDGTYMELSELTGMKTFLSGLAGHFAAEEVRQL